MKYSKVTGICRWSQGNTQLTRGMSAADDHPLVLERPDLFDDAEPDAELAGPPAVLDVPPPGPVIERATAAPGEKRPTPRKTAQKGGTGE